MPPEITIATHLEIDGLPLATPAWRITDLSELRGDAPELRGENQTVPYHDGKAQPVRHWLDADTRILPIVVFGAADKDGTPYADPFEGLQANIDELKAALARPNHTRGDGTRAGRLHMPDGSVRAGRITIKALRLPIEGPAIARGVLELEIPGGVLRDEAATEVVSGLIPGGVPTNLIVPNPGTADQYEVQIELTGTASSQTVLANLTWDPAGDTFLEFNGDLSAGDVDIDTGLWTATRAGLSVIGLIDHGGHERWLPLQPGDNTIEITPTGGNVTVTVRHFAGYL